MANFTAQDVKKLRDITGVGMMECKSALVEADGDIEKAQIILREKGLAASQKKAGRITAEGIIAIASDDKAAAIVEVNAETDFVAKNKDFLSFVDAIAETILKENPADLEDLLALKLDGHDETVEAVLQDKILVIGENMVIRRFHRTEGITDTYLHGAGRIGVVTRFNTDDSLRDNDDFKELARDISMQIAAIAPKYISKDEVPGDEVEQEKTILTEQVIKEGKPEHIAEKIVEGRMGKFYEQVALLEQPFVKDGSLTVGKHVENASNALGHGIAVVEFHRYEVGEGLERRDEDFADEVASMIK